MTIASLWQEQLDQHSPAAVEFVGTSIVQIIFFWVISALYTALPSVFPEFSARHRIQKREKQPTTYDLWQCFIVAARNQTISILLHAAVIVFRGRKPFFRVDPTLPGILEIFCHVALAMLLHEVLFYYAHRLIHHPSLYSSVHKLHHRFVSPVALTAQYTTMAEHLFSSLMPVILPLAILNGHIVSFWIFLASGLVHTTTSHSGYDFFAQDHDLHHEKFLVNFGSMGLLDWWHGTDRLASDKSD